MAANPDLPMEVQAKLSELQAGVTSAHKKGNPLTEATSLLVLGNMQMQVSSYRDALESDSRALAIAQARPFAPGRSSSPEWSGQLLSHLVR